jgi:hypothetical protein
MTQRKILNFFKVFGHAAQSQGLSRLSNLVNIEMRNSCRDLQFYTESGFRGGPIIMVQIENEYGNYGYSDYPRDKAAIPPTIDEKGYRWEKVLSSSFSPSFFPPF